MIHRNGKNRLSILLLAILATISIATTVTAESDLDWLPAETPADSAVAVVIFLESTPLDVSIATASSSVRPTRSQRIKFVLSSLKSRHVAGIDAMESFLNRRSTVEPVRHWIVPAFSATLSPRDIQAVAGRPEVKRVVPDVKLLAIEPVETVRSASLATSHSSQLQQLGVPQLWAQGYTGKGRLVASFDTGVDYDHPALLSKWRGNSSELSAAWFSTISPTSPPIDRVGHGTHTMGIMIGSTASDTIGVAPDAEWITAGVVDQGKPLNNTLSDIIAAFQWSLNPDGNPQTTDDVPDVILNSWGIPAGIFAPCDDMFWQVIDNVEAAGIVTIFSAGNEGPTASSIRTPADRPSSPINSLAVGAVDNSLVIASFSSRGPSSCDANQIKPEVVAPGVSIRSSANGGGYIEMSGTSMAAPYIAGLVALAREHSPNATVEEIKWAMLNSAIDLGPLGEDNAYGHGFVNGPAMLEILEADSRSNYEIAEARIEENGTAFPGEQSSLILTITRGQDDPTFVHGKLVAEDDNLVSVPLNELDFYFITGDTISTGNGAFQIAIDASVVHGEFVSFLLALSDFDGLSIDTLGLDLQVGFEPVGAIGEHASGSLVTTVSDFGMLGFAPGSIYNLAGEGFRYNGSGNLLYEGGLVIGYDDGSISSAVRSETGQVRRSDFVPIDELTAGWLDTAQGFHRVAKFADATLVGSPAVTIRQQTIDFSGIDDDGIIIFQYFLINESPQDMAGVRFGFMTDFDMGSEGEEIQYDDIQQLLWQASSSSPYIGLVGMKNVANFRTLANGEAKQGFTDSEWSSILNDDSAVAGMTDPVDLMTVLKSAAFEIAAYDSVEVTFALVVAATLDELYSSAERARARYFVVTNVEETTASLPSGFQLHQNYPNPFNPVTNINFELSAAADVTLEVYNLLGQQVSTLYSGRLGSGGHRFEWDATNDAANEVASGVYFYRLSVGESAQTRKMLLLR